MMRGEEKEETDEKTRKGERRDKKQIISSASITINFTSKSTELPASGPISLTLCHDYR